MKKMKKINLKQIAGLSGWIVAIILAVVIVFMSKTGDKFSVEKIVEINGATKDFFIGKKAVRIGGKNWVSFDEPLLNLIIVNDKECGEACDTTDAVSKLRTILTPALVISKIDINSEKGEDTVKRFKIDRLPTYLLGEELINIEIENEGGEKISMKKVMSEVLDSVNGFWKIKAEAMNFAVGKYLNGLDVDEKGDFKIGNGPVKVIEFSDFQCPYCQKFYLENNEQIMKLVADGRITYLFKDFPLRFHKESFAFHEVAGCIVRKSNSDIYKKFVNEVFTRKDEWENKTGQEMKSILKFLGNTGITEKDQKAVLSCYEKGESKEDVIEDIAEGKDFGVGGTPTIFVGERKLPGAVSSAVLLETVELAEKDLKE